MNGNKHKIYIDKHMAKMNIAVVQQKQLRKQEANASHTIISKELMLEMYL